MRKTYAYSSIIIGVLVGLLVWTSSESLVLGIVVCLGISIIGFVIIRVIENAISKGVDKAADAAANAYRKRKQRRQ